MCVIQGTLPVDYMSDSGLFTSHVIFANARQILEQYSASISIYYCSIGNDTDLTCVKSRCN